MRKPIYILSDLHLGHPAAWVTDVEMLRPILAGAGTVIFNGDTWQALAEDLIEHSTALFDDLVGLCEELEVEYYFLPGNHDPDMDQTPGWLEIGEIAVLHGDVIHPEVSPWSQYYLSQKDEIDALVRQSLDEGCSLRGRFSLAHQVVELMSAARRPLAGQSRWRYYLSLLWPPVRLWRILTVKKSALKQAFKFTRQYFPHASVMVFGHFHFPIVYQDQGLTLMNTGAMMEGCQSQVVIITSASIEVCSVRRGTSGELTLSQGNKWKRKVK